MHAKTCFKTWKTLVYFTLLISVSEINCIHKLFRRPHLFDMLFCSLLIKCFRATRQWITRAHESQTLMNRSRTTKKVCFNLNFRGSGRLRINHFLLFFFPPWYLSFFLRWNNQIQLIPSPTYERYYILCINKNEIRPHDPCIVTNHSQWTVSSIYLCIFFISTHSYLHFANVSLI